jgi:glycosyltransferase involved in cell wall biosynthesis
MEQPSKPLRILGVLYLPWDAKLGASRVWMELADEWQKMGHSVDHFCLTDAYPNHSNWRALIAIRQIAFARRAASYIQQHSESYDVIDALLGTLPFSKTEIGFRGLLVARSVGFYRLYEEFETLSQQRWPDQPKGSFPGRLLYSRTRKRSHQAASKAIQCADLLNLPNTNEEEALRREVSPAKPAIVQPYGLNPSRAGALDGAAKPAGIRLAQRRISFIGMWSLRKGSRDWAQIIRLIHARIPDASFRFLGTMVADEIVLADLGLSDTSRIELVSEFQPEQLPGHLSDCTLGVFPSYVEGFGLAILEQLAAGLPTIAYDVPGPRQILEPLRERLLTQAGNVKALAARATAILEMDAQPYSALAEASKSLASNYSWPRIAADTIDCYQQALFRMNPTVNS